MNNFDVDDAAYAEEDLEERGRAFREAAASAGLNISAPLAAEPPQRTTEELVTIGEAARRLGVSPSVVRRGLKTGQYKGRFEAHSKGSRWMVSIPTADEMELASPQLNDGAIKTTIADLEAENERLKEQLANADDMARSLAAALEVSQQATAQALALVEQSHALVQQAQALALFNGQALAQLATAPLVLDEAPALFSREPVSTHQVTDESHTAAQVPSRSMSAPGTGATLARIALRLLFK